jgi:long-subunit acyl-CoA synthetase (AMP-forming)
VQKFRICPEDFSVVNGDLTPTLKLKRSVVVGKYDELVEDMYNSHE